MVAGEVGGTFFSRLLRLLRRWPIRVPRPRPYILGRLPSDIVGSLHIEQDPRTRLVFRARWMAMWLPRLAGGIAGWYTVKGLMSKSNVLDAAQYILDNRSVMTTWKLQKLVYYSQAWSLVWDEVPLFHEPIEAWANGPVVPDLYSKHRGRYRVTKVAGGKPARLSAEQRETIDAVLEAYGEMQPWQLSEMTHREPPWQQARARAGLTEGERGNAVITHPSMARYYGELG